MGGKFLLRGLENAKPHPFGIALPFQSSLCLGQISRSMMVSGRMYHVPVGLRMNDARSVVIACDKREAFAQGANGSAQSAAR
jgi:hypothetical protein